MSQSAMFELPKWSARNPLGIIALFISLIYGMSALLLGASVEALTPNNQTILVVFIALFPPVVLFTFAWLVANHHRKLYSPADYRSDEGFLAENAPPTSIGARLTEEVAAVDEQDSEGIPNQQPELSQEESVAATPGFLTQESPGSQSSNSVATAYLLEGLVFQELQSEYRRPVQRQIIVRTPDRTLRLDGLVQTESASFAVEIKIISGLSQLDRRIRDAAEQIAKIHAVKTFDGKPLMPVIVFVCSDEVDMMRVHDRTIELFSSRGMKLSVDYNYRAYSRSALLGRYGLSEEVS